MREAGKSIAFWGIVLVVMIVAVAVVVRGGGRGGQANVAGALDTPVQQGEWTKGNPNAQIQIVEYSDYQCPYCANYFPIIEAVATEFQNHISFTYRHFPLRRIHPNAQISAQAGEAAGLQGRFWEMTERIFETQSRWQSYSPSEAEDYFISLAGEMGLDVEKFEEDIASNAVEDAVNEDYSSATASGVGGTPTFFLNGEQIQTPGNLEAFRELIREEINSLQDASSS